MRIDFSAGGGDFALLSDRPATLDEVVAPGLPTPSGARPDAARFGIDIRTGAVLPSRPARTAGLEVRVVGGPGAGGRVGIGTEPVVVGRDPGPGVNDLVIDDPTLSRQHLVLEPDGGVIRVRDLGSTNATRVGGEPVTAAVLEPGALVRIGTTVLSVERPTQVPAAIHWRPDGVGVVNRPPGPPDPSPPKPVERVIAPAPQPPGRIAWLSALLPALFGMGLAWRLHNPQFLLFMLASPLMMLGSSAGDRLSLGRRRRAEVRSFRRARAAQDRELASRLAEEGRHRRRRMPDPATVADIVELPGSRLWELSAAVGLRVRAGTANVPSDLQVSEGGAVQAAGQIPDTPAQIDLAPGSVGVCGPEDTRRAIARWLVCQIAARYSPAEVDIALALDEESEPRWRWARWLPHVFHTRQVACSEHDWTQLTADILAKVSAGDPTQRAGQWAGRRLVVVVDRAGHPTRAAALAAALGGSRETGVSAVWLAGSRHDLPGCCTSSIVVDGATGAHAIVSGHRARVLLDTVDVEYAERLARSLAPLVDGAERGGAHGLQPARLTDLTGLREVDPADVLGRWSDSDTGASTVIGSGVTDPVVLDLVRDGPHALVAGTTGSGKSELLQSLVAGLAINHPPDRLSFVLIDYKGGAAFAECSRLPHVTGMVTDLDHHLTSRALRSLHAELTRRERLFAAAGAADLQSYLASPDATGLARLVIVVDEFAALAEELPEFVTGLVGVAQRGRSLGVHLVLATQRPGGVVSADIRANTALRIALRVTDPAESADIVGTAEAAAISRHDPGRAYVARDGELVQVQIARVSAPARVCSHDDQPRVVPLGPWRTLLPDVDRAGDTTDLALLCDAMSEAWARRGAPRPARPWLPPLADVVTVEDLAIAPGGRCGEVVLGVADLPDRQCQERFGIDVDAGGSLLLAGASRSGRTTVLMSIALGTLRRRPDAQIYAIAPNGGPITCLRSLPQCGTVAADAEAAEALIAALTVLIDERTRLLAGTSGVRGGAGLAPLVLLVDDFESFLALSEEHDLGTSAERVQELLRSAARAAGYVAVAGGRGVLVPRLTGLVEERLILRMADDADYASAGLPVRAVPAFMPPGRAIRARDGVEIALALPHRRGGSLVGAVQEMATAPPGCAMHRAGDHPRPGQLIRVRPLPVSVNRDALPAPPPLALVLGLAGSAAAPCLVRPFVGAGRFLIAGPSRSGRSTALLGLARQAYQQRIAVQFVAPSRSPLAALAARCGLDCLTPAARALPPADGRRLMIIDDCDAFADTDIADQIVRLLDTDARLSVIAATRTDDLAVSFRGIAAHLRRSRVLALLQPSAADAELIGQRGRQVRPTTVAGRGLLLADPDWDNDLPRAPVPLQIALDAA